MTAINSNRAIRGPVTAVPVVAGKGVRLVADTENNRWVVEADETVLWEDANGATSATLSEAITNFDRVVIVAATPEMEDKHEFVVKSDATVIHLSCWFVNTSGTYIVHALGNYAVSNNGVTLTGGQLIHMWFSASNFQHSGTGTTGIKIFQVRGIHRIASN